MRSTVIVLFSILDADEGYSALLLLAPDDDVALVMSSNYFDQEEFNPSAWETAIEAMRTILEKSQ